MKYFNSKYLTIDKLSEYSHDMISLRLKEIVKRYNITEYPINCFKLLERIILSNTIKLEYEENDQFDNLDAAAEYHGKKAGYRIVFNSRRIGSFDFSPNRSCNFTLAHELGHIFLGHLLIPTSHKSEEDILYQEWEADEFAARLLMPKTLILNCNFITKVTAEFLVSSPALFTRVNNLKRLDLYKSKPVPTCKTCGNTHFSLCTKYCKICGTEVNKSTTRGVMRIIYSKFINGSNKCHEYGHENDWNARYCELCGQPTLYNDILPAWQVERKKYIKSLVRVEYREKKTS
jgi:hypothetical protein